MRNANSKMATRFNRLWETKNKSDEWWSSFVTSPIAIGLNMIVVEWAILTPNIITTLSIFCSIAAAICIVMNTFAYFVSAVILLHLSHVLDCMDGQMAKYRGVSTPFGSFYDKVTDQLKVFLFFGACSYAAFQNTGDETAIFLGFTGVCFYFIRVYVKYLTIFIEMEADSNYLSSCSKISSHYSKNTSAGLGAGFWNNLIWFAKEQRKFFLFNEAVFIFLISFALLFDLLMEILWIFALSQVYYGLRRSFQRGRQIFNSQHEELLEPMEK